MNFDAKWKIDVALAPVPIAARAPGRIRRSLSFLRRHFGFLAFVVLPTALAAAYYGLVAAPVYVSTTEFVVKDSTQSASVTGLGQFLQSAGLAASSNDAYSVNAYIMSRDALVELEKKMKIRDFYNRPEADFLTQFPNFLHFFRSSFEHLYWHYSAWVDPEFDSMTNITTIYAYAYRPDDAQAIAGEIMTLAEKVVNAMNDRANRDGLKTAKAEVEDLQKRAHEIQGRITDFRGTGLVLDPNLSAQSATSLRASLDASLSAARAALDQFAKMSPGSPQIPALRQRVKALEDQVVDREQRDTGGSDSLAPKVAQYDALQLEQQFVQLMLQAAVTALEAAEVKVQQQQLYIETVAEPNRPDFPQYPYRGIDAFLVFVTSLLVFGCGKMMFTAIREHTSA